jgi:hypothetical protein
MIIPISPMIGLKGKTTMKTKLFPLFFLALILLLAACGPAATTQAPSGKSIVTMDLNGVAQSATVENIPAVSGTDVPMTGIMPEYTRLTLEGYPAGKHSVSPQIFVFPVQGLDVNQTAAKMLQDLQTVLQGGQEMPKMPYLPLYNQAQMLHAQVKFMDFKNGKGVRYLTEWSQGIVPVNSRGLIYTYQGLTSDGKYYVAAVLPVNLDSLPADESSTGNLPAEFSSDYTKYLSNTAAMLDQQAANAFSIDISKLDALVQSIEVK